MRTAKFILVALLPLLANTAFASPEMPAPEMKSPGFKKMKELVGTWKGSGGDMGDGEVEVDYSLTSGGTAVLETLFPGTPHEMQSVYFEENGKLFMTHYCTMGNHPTMELKKMDDKNMEFTLANKNHFDPKKEAHMHSLKMTFMGPDELEARWAMNAKGKEEHASVFKLKKVS